MSPQSFGKRLIAWHRAHPRPLPWADGVRDAYPVWVSEIIMQQTRIGQGGPYLKRFLERFPDVQSLAAASLDDVLHAWEGLGYYSRARNLHKAAHIIFGEHGGQFPKTYLDILALPGIGPYSAAAIASFAFNLPYPVVDGNVKRVMARYTGFPDSVDTPAAHRHLTTATGEFMKGSSPGEFNQAIMNFGALVCRPRNPLCAGCPLRPNCAAHATGQTDLLPVRTPKKSPRSRYFHFIILRYRNRIGLVKRSENDIWQGLRTPPMLEGNSERKPLPAAVRKCVEPLIGHDKILALDSSEVFRQVLSHQAIAGRFHVYDLVVPPMRHPHLSWYRKEQLDEVAKPRLFHLWLNNAHAQAVLQPGKTRNRQA